MSRPVAAALLATALAACAAEDASTSTESAAITCFHTASQILCAHDSTLNVDESRTKVEDFYPSACLDGDADGDGVPDYLDLDFLGSDDADAEVARDDLRCPRCNRGPGTQNDFRLRVEGTSAELDRGKVYEIDAAGTIVVPTPDGVLRVVVTADTEIDDGPVAPGAEIRVEGEIVGVVDAHVAATRLKVLCPAPAAMPTEEVPPEADPPAPENPEDIEIL